MTSEERIYRAINAAVLRIREKTVRSAISEAIENRDMDAALRMIAWAEGEGLLEGTLPALLRDIFNDYGAEAMRSIPTAGRFDITNPYAVEYARNRSALLIREFGESSRDAIRKLTAESIERGIPAAKTALRIIESGIGLTERQAMAVENYRRRLDADENVNLTDAEIERRANRYADKLLRQRAKTIAITENAFAQRAGQRESWRQAVERGFINPATARQEWIAEADACDDCLGLDGKIIGFNEQFPATEHYPAGGPAKHPLCRCTVALILP